MTELLGLLAGIIGIVGYIPYIRDVLKGSTKPERASWIIWSLEYAVLFVAQLKSGATESLWVIGLQVIGVIIISVLSLHYGLGGLDRSNIILFVCVGVALTLWYFTKNPTLTILLLVAVEMIGTILTARKVYRRPGSETLIMWICLAFAGMLGIVAVGRSGDPIVYVYPAALIMMGFGVIVADWIGTKEIHFNPPDKWVPAK
jgi:hypothetical protein